MSDESLKDKAVNAIIRPPRKHYVIEDIPLIFDAGDDNVYIRHPLNFSNERDQKIVGSIYVKEGQNLMDGGPCVIYMHGNASSQLEGQFLVPQFCPMGVAVYCFDFSGCGESEGDFISLGYYEKQDVEYLMWFLNSSFNLGPFALWGRSMGAATSVLARGPLIASIIVDSTFTSINEICAAIGKSQKLPSIAIPAVLWVLKRLVSGKAGFDMNEVSPLEAAKKPGAVPCIIGHATDDEFIPIDQGRQVFMAYSNPDKEFVHLIGGHNGRRKEEWITKCIKFVMKHFKMPCEDFKLLRFKGFNSQEDQRHFSSFNDMVSNK
jgi:pimeloyl-ACP methyl ester carboxylesterase